MDTQEHQAATTGASKPDPVRSRKLIALIAGATVLVILAAIGVYFVAFRSLPTTVSWAPSVSVIAPGDEITVAGRVTPAEGGRKVSIESAPSTQGPWQHMPGAATTDSSGRFAVTFGPPITASIVMRVVVAPAGRYLEVTGQSMPLRILVPSTISLKGGGTIATNTVLSFTAMVDPAKAARTVRIEQSGDKVHWVPVGPSTLTDGDGTSAVKVHGPAVGSWYYRATVTKDDKYAAAVSPAIGVTVEDIEAAAATYLSITDAHNATLASFYNTLEGAYSSSDVIGSLRLAAMPLAAEEARAAAQLRAYGSWPRSVKPAIVQITAQYVIEAESDRQRSAATSVDFWNTVTVKRESGEIERGRLSTTIRQALGLPQSSVDSPVVGDTGPATGFSGR